MENFETHKDAPGEETLIEYSEGREYNTKTLNNGLPNLEVRIAQLEQEGWKIFKRGNEFVVLEREKAIDDKPIYH